VKSSNPKECILIIDEQTGEVTIERLGRTAVLKKTRQGLQELYFLAKNTNDFHVDFLL